MRGGNGGGLGEVGEDGVTGYIVRPLNPRPTAEATVRLLGDADLRGQMGRAGRERVVERFSVERCVEVHLQAYDYALRHSGREARKETSLAR